jgi:hypothetical protein
MGSELSEALAQARGLGLGLVLAHQYLAQLPATVQAAVLGTVRSQIAFQLEYDDAKLLERRFRPALSADDLSGLEVHEIAARLCIDGTTSSPVTGSTVPLPKPHRQSHAVANVSHGRYGSMRRDVEAALRARITVTQAAEGSHLGRVRRSDDHGSDGGDI